jgi:hypothetical protein
MRKAFPIIVILGCALFTADSSHAQDSWSPRFGAEAFGAWNTYSMEDINDFIDGVNTAAGTTFEKIENGYTGGFGLRYWPNANWMLSAVWEPLLAQSLDESGGQNANRLNLNANSYQFNIGYFFPSQTSSRYGISAGVGLYEIVGFLVDNTDLVQPYTQVEGNDVGFHGMGHAEWELVPGLALAAGAGYRIADIGIDETSPEIDASYTGFMGRLGLSFSTPLNQP